MISKRGEKNESISFMMNRCIFYDLYAQRNGKQLK